MRAFRIVVCLDVEADDLAGAYRRVYDGLGKVETDTGAAITWESSDEWYGADGEPVDVETVTATRMAVFAEVAS